MKEIEEKKEAARKQAAEKTKKKITFVFCIIFLEHDILI